MKHKPFEEWILSDDEPVPKDRKALYDHLRACDECFVLDKNWRQVEQLIEASPVAGPRFGFSDRWQARLVQVRRQKARRQSLAMLGATSIAAGLFLFLSGVQFIAQLDQIVIPMAAYGSQAAGFLDQTWQTAVTAGQIVLDLPAQVPALLLMAFFAAFGAAAVAWLKLFRMLARLQGYTRWA